MQESSEPHRVESFFPEPETVPNNAAGAAYDLRLVFIRQTLASHLAMCGVVALAVHFLPVKWGLIESLMLFLAGLAVLSAQRRLVKSPRGLYAELAVLAPTLLGLAFLLRHYNEAGWPVWVFALTMACIGAYAALCGRDFSFLGMFAIATFGLCGLLAAGFWLLAVPWMEVWTAFALGIVHIAYITYDLATLLLRRRPGEHMKAGIDLFRDVLNFTTYSVRVVRHWQGYRFD